MNKTCKVEIENIWFPQYIWGKKQCGKYLFYYQQRNNYIFYIII